MVGCTNSNMSKLVNLVLIKQKTLVLGGGFISIGREVNLEVSNLINYNSFKRFMGLTKD